MKRRVLIGVVLLTVATAALASWYDDYDAGIDAIKKGNWQLAIQKMSSAIAGNPKENNNARTYGNIFYNYHPFYYRGLAYLRTGQYDKAIKDFEQTSGPGEVDRGSIDELMHDAKTKLASASTPEPQPQPAQPQPKPVPAGPVIDAALRQQVNNAINAANQSLAGARGRNAGNSTEYRNALNALTQANQHAATAKSNDDLQAALAEANNAKLFADSAVAPQPPTTTVAVAPQPPAPAPRPSKPTVATGAVLGDTAKRVRRALVDYFNGDFDQAATQFEQLTQEMPTNGWIWAFLGASQYSQYAFEADETYREAALKSFRKAKQYGKWKDGLPQKYFSKRIRAAFAQAS